MITIGNVLYVRNASGEFVPVMGGGGGNPTDEQVQTAVDNKFANYMPAAVSVDVDENGTIVLTGGEAYEDGNEVAY